MRPKSSICGEIEAIWPARRPQPNCPPTGWNLDSQAGPGRLPAVCRTVSAPDPGVPVFVLLGHNRCGTSSME